ncbi:hypothetical protein M9H77_25269 [Catharanthus roseus]|uniref:Uncharacterized protein n=1 Tax=Catharanthus roseus TaxID=4058 RepID=A0ACC0AAF0_CATRO|nr:hypothetical protein M9H77_25269 [Catharanthus roseus]
MGNSNSRKSLPIDKSFNLPSPIPSWPQGGGFASGYIDLGGLEVHQISSFNKIWATYEGGPDDLGATFYQPSQIPDGFFILGYYSQPNNKPLFGSILVAKDNTPNQESPILIKPTDYSLIWSSNSSKINQTSHGYIWLPESPDGYKAIGYVVTTTSDKPSLEKIRCVRSDFTDELETENLIWGQEKYGLNVYSSRPKNRGIQAQGVPIGTFLVQSSINGTEGSPASSISCLKNNNFLNFSSMPNLNQVEELFKEYAPQIYFHSKEKYLPSSVNWYFEKGAKLYTKGENQNPVSIEKNGSNLPQGGSNDGNFWIGLPIDEKSKEEIKKGNLQSSEVYLQIKPIFGGTFTDIPIWIFYPFNGPSTAKIGLIDIPLGQIGEHIGDWEHLTLRISNFNGILHKVYLSEHSKGTWVDSSLLEFQNGSNKPVAYSARNGHPLYPKPGIFLQGGENHVGIRNDTEKSSMVMDTGARFSVVSAEFLGPGVVVEPPWLNYFRKWGPNVTYEIGVEVEKIEGTLSGGLKSAFGSLVHILPKEVYGAEGPLGPKMKNSWNGDER